MQWLSIESARNARLAQNRFFTISLTHILAEGEAVLSVRDAFGDHASRSATCNFPHATLQRPRTPSLRRSESGKLGGSTRADSHFRGVTFSLGQGKSSNVWAGFVYNVCIICMDCLYSPEACSPKSAWQVGHNKSKGPFFNIYQGSSGEEANGQSSSKSIWVVTEFLPGEEEGDGCGHEQEGHQPGQHEEHEEWHSA